VLSPSDLQQWGPVDRPIVLGPALAVRGQPEMNRLGEAVHGFLAADRTDLSAAAREALAEGLLARFAVTGALAPADLLEASRRLAAFLAERWPGARLRREWPLRHRLGDGTLVVGQPDLVVESAGELAVIDHKTLSGGLRRAVQEAAGYAGQVATYAHALTAALGLPVRGCFLHLPLSGVVVALEPKQLELAV
jgi:ATP-dependent helicase/nuclease subunit A